MKVVAEKLSQLSGDVVLVPVDAAIPTHFGPTCSDVLRLMGREEVPFQFGGGRARFEYAKGEAVGQYKEVGYLGTIVDTDQEKYAASALQDALSYCASKDYRRIVLPLFTGGWRIQPVDAVHLFLNVVDAIPGAEGWGFVLAEPNVQRRDIIHNALAARGYR